METECCLQPQGWEGPRIFKFPNVAADVGLDTTLSEASLYTFFHVLGDSPTLQSHRGDSGSTTELNNISTDKI